MAYSEDPQKLNKLIRKLNGDSVIHFYIDSSQLPANTGTKTWDNEIETVLMKMAVYADKVIFLCGNMRLKEKPDDSIHYYNHIASLARNAHLGAKFEEIFYFLPASVEVGEYIHDYWDDGSGDAFFDGKKAFDFYEHYHYRNGYPIQLNNERFISHFLEKDATSHHDGAILNLWLPQVKNVPFGTFLMLRKDNEESFQKLQYALKKFLGESKEQTTEAKLKELFEFLHYEIVHYNDEMEKIRKSRALRTTQMVISTCIVGFAFAINSDVMETITSFLGLYQGKDYFNYLIQHKEIVHDLESSDFYLPWLMNKENLRPPGFFDLLFKRKKNKAP